MKLNLKANNPAEERIKAYLEANASESLARKINEGTPLIKDGVLLTNRKTLSGFMQYATAEAQKIAEKGAKFACIDDTTVFGWAIHYFEEQAVVGELFNTDGTPYKAVISPKEKQRRKFCEEPTPKAPPKPQPKAPAQKTAKILPTAKVAEAPKPKAEPKKSTSTTYTAHEQISLFDLF